jgi:hypothetical protein
MIGAYKVQDVMVTVRKTLWETTAQFAHAGTACAIMEGVRKYSSLRVALIVGGVALVAAAIKEFWYDQNYETTDERGSNLLDFSMYAVGIVLGLLL